MIDDERDEGQPAAPGEPGEAAPEPESPDAPEPESPDAPGPESPDAPGPEVGGDEQLEEQAADAGPEAPEEGAPEPPEQRAKPGRRGKKDDQSQEEVIPGAHLEPDLVLEDAAAEEEGGLPSYAGAEAVVEDEAEAPEEPAAEEPAAEEEESAEPVARQPIDLAADARYRATGKRKRAVARVILRPGEGRYSVNGRALDEAFPRVRLQKLARQPLDTAGYGSRMDVVARIHGGGVSAQAGALRHGVARALVEADPSLRGDLKRRGFLTRDPRQKERKKAGLKKARKRPQFSKR